MLSKRVSVWLCVAMAFPHLSKFPHTRLYVMFILGTPMESTERYFSVQWVLIGCLHAVSGADQISDHQRQDSGTVISLSADVVGTPEVRPNTRFPFSPCTNSEIRGR